MEYRFKSASDYPSVEDGAPELTLAEVQKEADRVFRLYLQHKDAMVTRAELAPLHKRIISEFFAVRGMPFYVEKPWSSCGRIPQGEGVWLNFELVFGFYERYFSEIGFRLLGREVRAYAKIRDGHAAEDQLYSKDYDFELVMKQPQESLRTLATRVLAEAHEQIHRIATLQLANAQQDYNSLVSVLHEPRAES